MRSEIVYGGYSKFLVAALVGGLVASVGCGGGGDDGGGTADAAADARRLPDSGGGPSDGPQDDAGLPDANPDSDIRELQNGTVAPDSPVNLVGVVVTARTDSASSTVLFVQEPSGDPDFSGILVFVDTDPAPSFTLPAVGDVVSLSGTVSEYTRDGFTGSRTNIDPVTNITVTGTATLPAATILTEADLTGATANLWEGVLVQIDVAEVATRDAAGAVTLTGGLVVDDRMFAWAQPYPGDTYAAIVGVVDFDFGTPRLYPRTAGDLVGHVAAAPRVSDLSPPTATVSQGESVTMTVTLDRPAPVGGQFVDLSSSAPATATVDVTVLVEAAATTATFPVDAIATGGPVTITATSGGASDTSMITVVPAGGAVPGTVTGAASVVTSGGTGVAIVTLDRVSPAGGTVVTLTSSATGSVVVPASVSIPAGATEGTFGVRGGATAGASTITATAGGTSVTATVTAVAAGTAPTVLGQLVVNEVLYDPPGAVVGDVAGDANCSGARGDDDEFVELHNVTTGPLNLTGVSIWEDVSFAGAATPRFTFGAFTLGAGESVTVFGGAPGLLTGQPWCAGATAGRVGDAAAFGTGTLTLNNTGDTVIVTATASAASVLLDSLAYLNGTADDQAYTRDPDGFGLFTTHGAAAGHATDRVFTPGTRLTGQPWASVRP